MDYSAWVSKVQFTRNGKEYQVQINDLMTDVLLPGPNSWYISRFFLIYICLLRSWSYPPVGVRVHIIFTSCSSRSPLSSDYILYLKTDAHFLSCRCGHLKIASILGPSSLHQKIKFIIGTKLITIFAEEDFTIYKSPTIPVIESVEPSSFQAFECVTGVLWMTSRKVWHSSMVWPAYRWNGQNF